MRRPRTARRYALAAAIWLLLGPLSLSIVLSAVTIAGFEVEAGEAEIFVYWETASETDNLGFYVWRSEQPDTGYVKLPIDVPESQQFIPSEDLGFGAFYEFTDEQVTPGILYYYKLQDYPASGSPIFVGPESTGIGLEAATPTPSATAIQAATATATPAANATATVLPTSTAAAPTPGSTQTPRPSVRFWAEETTLAAGECTTVQWTTSNVRALFFDGDSVTGQESRTVCPCEDQTHTLRVIYRDGSSETFSVMLSVSGACDGSPAGPPASPLVTPTSLPVARRTETPRANATPRADATLPADAAVTTMPTASTTEQMPTTSGGPTASSTAPVTPEATVSPSVTAAVDATVVPVGETLTADDGLTNGGVVVEGRSVSRSPSLGLFLAFAAIAGVGLVAVGVWLWRRG